MQNVLQEYRRIVPLWRSIRKIFASNELASPGSRAQNSTTKTFGQIVPELTERIQNFRSNPDVVTAAELVEVCNRVGG